MRVTKSSRKSLLLFLCFALIVSWGVTLNPASSNATGTSLTPPELESPANGSYASSAPTFQWSNVSDADYYRLEIATDDEFNIKVLSQYNIKQNSFDMHGLVEGKEYYWKVLAINDDSEESALSDVYRFTVPYDATVKPMNQPVEIQEAGTEVSFNSSDDSVSSTLPIGFDFYFYGKKQTELYANTNGLLMFDGPTSNCCDSDEELPFNQVDNNGVDHFITAFYDDLYMGSSSKVIYRTIGEEPNRKFVIQYTNMMECCSDNGNPFGTFQVILYEGTNDIQFQYPNLVGLKSEYHAFGSEALIGIQGLSGDYVVYSQWSISLTEKQAIRFSPNGQSYTMLRHGTYEPIFFIPESFPAAPILIAPADGSVLNLNSGLDLETVFEWGGVDETQYELQIARSAEFIPYSLVSLEDGLEYGTKYYWKVKAVNDDDGYYTFSNTYSFTTESEFITQPPTVVTDNASSITSMTATVGGNVIADGSATVAKRGIVYSLNANPTYSDKVAEEIGGTGAFTVDLAGLQSNTTYHSRAYAISDTQITYGQDVTFTTLSSNVSLSALSLSGITLDQSVSGSVYLYTASVPNTVSSTTVTTTVQEAVYRSVTANVFNSGNTLVFGPIDLASGQISGPIPLNVGTNKIEIVVLAIDGSGTTYTVTVTRAAAPSSGGGGGGAPSVVTSKDGNLTLPVGKAGEVSLDNDIEITIPASASNKQLELTIEKLLSAQGLLGNKEILASSVYEILKNFTENFDKPVTITISFDASKLKSGQTVAIFYYDEVKKTWVKVEGGKISKDRISADVNHFTKFAALVVDETTGSPVLEQSTSTTTDPTTEVKFSDIAKHWAEASIKQAVNSGIVKGYTDGTFKPNATVTRAEFAVMLMNALKPQGDGAELTFTDNAKIGAWAQKAVAQAVEANIIKGNQDGSFRPNAEVTRAEMAVMIANALGQSVEANTATGFADEKDIPAWAKGSVAIVKQASIVQGKSGNKFAPQDNATRAEAVTVLLKMLGYRN